MAWADRSPTSGPHLPSSVPASEWQRGKAPSPSRWGLERIFACTQISAKCQTKGRETTDEAKCGIKARKLQGDQSLHWRKSKWDRPTRGGHHKRVVFPYNRQPTNTPYRLHLTNMAGHSFQRITNYGGTVHMGDRYNYYELGMSEADILTPPDAFLLTSESAENSVRQFFSWLSPLDYQKRQKNMVENTFAATAHALLEDVLGGPEFTWWQEGSPESLRNLWCHGNRMEISCFCACLNSARNRLDRLTAPFVPRSWSWQDIPSVSTRSRLSKTPAHVPSQSGG